MGRAGISLRPGSRVLRGSSVRRLTEWASIVTTQFVNIAANTFTSLVDLDAAILEPLVPCTLVRIRGEIMIQGDNPTLGETQVGSLGIAKVLDSNVGASLPDPFLDAGNDMWLYWRSLLSSGKTAFQVAADTVGTRQHYEIDAKAMRKFVDGDKLQVMVSNHHAADAFEILFQARFLFLLH